jgi:tRNA-splicing ligase RtcB
MKAENLITISDNLFEIPPDAKKGMIVPARIYASGDMIREMDEAVFDQITNVALLPGIQKYALCMPDGHSGYGFPIGGVAAMDPETGVISPGGIGFDINCGIRLVATNLTLSEVAPKLDRLIQELFQAVPSGVGNEGILHLSRSKLDQAVSEGVRWAVKNGWGEPDDLLNTEDGGRIGGSDPDEVSDREFQRGKNQIGTLGSGNHFLEIQVAKKENVFDPELASRLGIVMDDQIFVMIHTGSRGYGTRSPPTTSSASHR